MKKYLFLAATSALMFAACSDDINNAGDNNFSPENGIRLTELNASSQSGRVEIPGQTKGMKAERLELVMHIKPVNDTQTNKWSATGITFIGDNAYVSWHSDHQASDPSNVWGGAIDQLNVNAIADKDAANVLLGTLKGTSVKFNNVVADGGKLYLPMTCYNNGAVVGRMTPGATTMDTISLRGSSANSVEVVGTQVYAVTGYAGGVYDFPATNFGTAKKDRAKVNETVKYAEDFGGKYVTGQKVLRTDDASAYLVDLTTGMESKLGAPLKSTDKYAEAYDAANKKWYTLSGDKAAHFGKHTMAIDKTSGLIYVGGGKGANVTNAGGVNGLRVYDAAGSLVWQNGTNTTGVCVDDEFVYAATGAGLRVYEKYDAVKKELRLYAYEVKEYDATGKAVGHEAGTEAKSSNFVAVHPGTGLIFVAGGQSGVYVFRLNKTVDVEKREVGISIPSIDYGKTEWIAQDETAKFTVPSTLPTLPANEEFVNWSGSDGKTYNPGDVVEVNWENPTVVLTPNTKEKEATLIVKFNGNNANATGVPEDQKSYSNEVKIPGEAPKCGNLVFLGWSRNANDDVVGLEDGDWTPIKPGDTFKAIAGEKVVTLYAIWATAGTAGGNQGGNPDPEPEDPSVGGGGSDVKPGTM